MIYVLVVDRLVLFVSMLIIPKEIIGFILNKIMKHPFFLKELNWIFLSFNGIFMNPASNYHFDKKCLHLCAISIYEQ